MWMTIILAIIAVSIVGVLLRFVFKIGLAVLLILLVVFFVSGYSPSDLLHFGQEKAKETVSQTVIKEVKSAQITDQGNGKFEIKSESLTATGDLKTNLVTVSFKGVKQTYAMNDNGVGQQIRNLIEEHLKKIN